MATYRESSGQMAESPHNDAHTVTEGRIQLHEETCEDCQDNRANTLDFNAQRRVEAGEIEYNLSEYGHNCAAKRMRDTYRGNVETPSCLPQQNEPEEDWSQGSTSASGYYPRLEPPIGGIRSEFADMLYYERQIYYRSLFRNNYVAAPSETKPESSSFKEQESSSFRKQESSSFRKQESSSFRKQESSSFRKQESSSFREQESSSFRKQESSSFRKQESSSFRKQESSSFREQEFSSVCDLGEPSRKAHVEMGMSKLVHKMQNVGLGRESSSVSANVPSSAQSSGGMRPGFSCVTDCEDWPQLNDASSEMKLGNCSSKGPQNSRRKTYTEVVKQPKTVRKMSSASLGRGQPDRSSIRNIADYIRKPQPMPTRQKGYTPSTLGVQNPSSGASHGHHAAKDDDSKNKGVPKKHKRKHKRNGS